MKEKYRGLKMEHFVSKLNESHVSGMIGFHAFTGCDQIRKYNGILKARHADSLRCILVLQQMPLVKLWKESRILALP